MRFDSADFPKTLKGLEDLFFLGQRAVFKLSKRRKGFLGRGFGALSLDCLARKEGRTDTREGFAQRRGGRDGASLVPSPLSP